MNKIIFCALAFFSLNVFAVELTPKGRITGYFTGWNQDQVRVKIEGASYIEGNCNVKDGYVTSAAIGGGYNTHVSALLAAYMAGKPIQLAIEGCSSNRPNIWGVIISD